MPGQISGVGSASPRREKNSYQCRYNISTFLCIYSFNVHVTSSFICLSVWTVKMLVYSAPIQNEDTLRQRLFYTCQTIRNAPGAFERVLKTMVRCVRMCIDSDGLYFKHFL